MRSGSIGEHPVPSRLGFSPELDAEAVELPLEVFDEIE